MEKLPITLGTIVPTFFWRENPISRKRKPACMNMTKTPATITQTVSTALIVSVRLGCTDPSSSMAYGPVVGVRPRRYGPCVEMESAVRRADRGSPAVQDFRPGFVLRAKWGAVASRACPQTLDPEVRPGYAGA